MFSLDAVSLKVWESVAEWGFVLVFVGVAGEGGEIVAKLFFKNSFKKRERAWDICSAVFWLVLVVGLAVELIGTHMATRIADRENARLTKEASVARLEAAQANERTVQLEIKALPRRISIKQRDEFIRLTKGSPKALVRVIAMTEDKETMDYAHHIREILDAAGFGNSSNKVECLARSYVPKNISPIDDLNKDLMLSVAFHNTLNKLTWPGIKFIEEATRIGSVYDPQDLRALPAIINITFANIGIKTGWACLPFYLKPGEWAVVVPQKF